MMIDRQQTFVFNLSRLVQFIYSRGFRVTLGEAFRTEEQQKIHFAAGRSKTMHSRHMQRLAQDYNIFLDGKMLFKPNQTRKELEKDLELVKPIGEYWMSLNNDNVWGADWNRNYNSLDESFLDPYHFEMKPEPTSL